MAKKILPLKEVSIAELFSGGEKRVYEIPIYQRNYAWEKDEIAALVQDIYDAYTANSRLPYFIGTLVSYHKGDQVYEIIDGQQRLTTIKLMLDALEIDAGNRLTYRARKKSDATLKNITQLNKVEEKDSGIVNGYRCVKGAIGDLDLGDDLDGFKMYFMNRVHIIHYEVPKDIDLNHYFEIMNSRGEQLEKHEIVKANLMEVLKDDNERKVFNRIWESCSEMNVYLQQNLEDIKPEDVFGSSLSDFLPNSFSDLVIRYLEKKEADEDALKTITIEDIIRSDSRKWTQIKEQEKKDSFLPIIDFPNFLLIVLKLTRMEEPSFSPNKFNLDDKELINEFRDAQMDSEKVKIFAYNLLKARFFLDNYVVHHSKEEDTIDSNPWKLQVWQKDLETRKGQLRNLSDNRALQDRLAHLLSMFEVSFTARQRKNYLFYLLLYLMKNDFGNLQEYAAFAEDLADRYFNKVYLDNSKLNSINTPLPGSFDEVMLAGNKLNESLFEDNVVSNSPLEDDIRSDSSLEKDVHSYSSVATDETGDKTVFTEIYGDGTEASRGIPLFVFNYLDYRIWKKYDTDIRGKEYRERDPERQAFFAELGCGDFGLKVFDQFYFSRTRRSLEHFYPQHNATGEEGALNQAQINCLGNYAMIGGEINSSGSNWSPETKLSHYLDSSGKISRVSVASLKFMIMMQICKDHQSWEFEEIQEHQNRMIEVLLGDI